jgi:hypothetical protein
VHAWCDVSTNSAATRSPRPDPDDGDAWKRRQDHLCLDFGDDRLEPHEIEFYERFIASGHRVTPIHRSPDARPTADFIWLDRDIDVELKTPLTLPVTYTRVARRIRNAVKAAAAAGTAKPNFMIDLGHSSLTGELREALTTYNEKNPGKTVERLFVFHAGVTEEIVLTT